LNILYINNPETLNLNSNFKIKLITNLDYLIFIKLVFDKEI